MADDIEPAAKAAARVDYRLTCARAEPRVVQPGALDGPTIPAPMAAETIAWTRGLR
ncbi:hypothetical protein [Micromonospora okii]|uniref:hypothetical protein n=1 Tax=Micromonospora okii TaxID=1182970 RepID=UPI001E5A6B5F|nr:hypothetical protein [Micromonospora okii]